LPADYDIAEEVIPDVEHEAPEVQETSSLAADLAPRAEDFGHSPEPGPVGARAGELPGFVLEAASLEGPLSSLNTETDGFVRQANRTEFVRGIADSVQHAHEGSSGDTINNLGILPQSYADKLTPYQLGYQYHRNLLQQAGLDVADPEHHSSVMALGHQLADRLATSSTSSDFGEHLDRIRHTLDSEPETGPHSRPSWSVKAPWVGQTSDRPVRSLEAHELVGAFDPNRWLTQNGQNRLNDREGGPLETEPSETAPRRDDTTSIVYSGRVLKPRRVREGEQVPNPTGGYYRTGDIVRDAQGMPSMREGGSIMPNLMPGIDIKNRAGEWVKSWTKGARVRWPFWRDDNEPQEVKGQRWHNLFREYYQRAQDEGFTPCSTADEFGGPPGVAAQGRVRTNFRDFEPDSGLWDTHLAQHFDRVLSLRPFKDEGPDSGKPGRPLRWIDRFRRDSWSPGERFGRGKRPEFGGLDPDIARMDEQRGGRPDVYTSNDQSHTLGDLLYNPYTLVRGTFPVGVKITRNPKGQEIPVVRMTAPDEQGRRTPVRVPSVGDGTPSHFLYEHHDPMERVQALWGLHQAELLSVVHRLSRDPRIVGDQTDDGINWNSDKMNIMAQEARGLQDRMFAIAHGNGAALECAGGRHVKSVHLREEFQNMGRNIEGFMYPSAEEDFGSAVRARRALGSVTYAAGLRSHIENTGNLGLMVHDMSTVDKFKDSLTQDVKAAQSGDDRQRRGVEVFQELLKKHVPDWGYPASSGNPGADAQSLATLVNHKVLKTSQRQLLRDLDISTRRRGKKNVSMFQVGPTLRPDQITF
jgi:hypothetical protein